MVSYLAGWKYFKTHTITEGIAPTGTVSPSGSTVTGTSTNFLSWNIGDTITIAGTAYPITVITSNTSLTVTGTPTSGAGQSYTMQRKNYQIPLSIYTGAGTDTGGTVYIPSAHIQYFPDDIDFAAPSNVEIPFWIEGFAENVGTIAVNNGSANVVGTSTVFGAWMVGLNFVTTDGAVYTVSSVTNTTHLALTGNYAGSNTTGANYKVYGTMANATSPITVWVKIPSIDSTNGATFYIYYYYSTSSLQFASKSSLANTFIYGTDFRGLTSLPADWTTSGTLSPSVANGQLVVAASGSSTGGEVRTNAVKTTINGTGLENQALRLHGKVNSGSSNTYGWALFGAEASGAITAFPSNAAMLGTLGLVTSYAYYKGENVKANANHDADLGTIATGTLAIWEICMSVGAVVTYENGTSKLNNTTDVPIVAMYIGAWEQSAGGNQSISFIVLRYCATTEPSQDTTGAWTAETTITSIDYSHTFNQLFGVKPVSITKIKTFNRIFASLFGLKDTPYWYIKGVTRNSSGVAVGSCTVILLRTSDNAVISTTTSDADDGTYSFTITSANKATAYYLVAFKSGSPDTEGVTDNNITGGVQKG